MKEIQEKVIGEEAQIKYRELRREKIPLPYVSELLGSLEEWGAGRNWQKYPHPCICGNGTSGTGCLPERVYILAIPTETKEEAGRLYVGHIIRYHAPQLLFIAKVTASRLRPPQYDFRVEELDIVERTFGRDSLISNSNGCPSG